jgi:hypothetical protein
MTIRLKPAQEHRIAEALRTDAYRSSYDVIDRALEALHEIEELERGKGIPEDELATCLARLKAQHE